MIKKLPEEVINKIAAGEIIQRPYSVIKETVENSIDAGSRLIIIKMNNGGLDKIQIVDDGKGIQAEDFPLLCERYATSKISSASDLQSLKSFGFRGEALASISLVSYVQVESRQEASVIGYRASYANTKLEKLEQFGCAQGYKVHQISTTITIEQLFYNLQARRELISRAEEKKQVAKLIQYFSFHFPKVTFKLYIDEKSEYASDKDRIVNISSALKVSASNLFSDKVKDETYKFKLRYVCTALGTQQYKLKREFCLFINDRLIDNDALRVSIHKAYQLSYLHAKEEIGGYFAYLAVKMDPQMVDPNVHPNKKEVKFINQQEICTILSDLMRSRLCNRQYELKQVTLCDAPEKPTSKLGATEPTFRPFMKIRNDPKQCKLDQFIVPQQKQDLGRATQQEEPLTNAANDKSFETPVIKSAPNDAILDYLRSRLHKAEAEQRQPEEGPKSKAQQEPRRGDPRFIYQNMVYVGRIDSQHIFISVETELYCVNFVIMLFNMFWCKIGLGQTEFFSFQKYSPPIVSVYKVDFERTLKFKYAEGKGLVEGPCSRECAERMTDDVITASRKIAEEYSLFEYSNDYVENKLFPFLKSAQAIPLEIKQYWQPVSVKVLFKYFERC